MPYFSYFFTTSFKQRHSVLTKPSAFFSVSVCLSVPHSLSRARCRVQHTCLRVHVHVIMLAAECATVQTGYCANGLHALQQLLLCAAPNHQNKAFSNCFLKNFVPLLLFRALTQPPRHESLPLLPSCASPAEIHCVSSPAAQPNKKRKMGGGQRKRCGGMSATSTRPQCANTWRACLGTRLLICFTSC